jgi:protein-L-isoaspartate(D-aspartate) O-methyltransferase
MGYQNVAIRCADGYNGWQEKAPFDAIIVTAAAAHIPPELVKQLKPGGRMVIPVGEPYMDQELILVNRDKHGKVTEKSILGVVFVPLVVDQAN